MWKPQSTFVWATKLLLSNKHMKKEKGHCNSSFLSNIWAIEPKIKFYILVASCFCIMVAKIDLFARNTMHFEEKTDLVGSLFVN